MIGVNLLKFITKLLKYLARIKTANLSLFLIYFVFLIPINIRAQKLKSVNLQEYGAITTKEINETIKKAINDIEGKCLILPSINLDLNNIIIKNKKNFALTGSLENYISCKNFQINSCSNFEISNIFIKGTIKKFTYFDIIGNCNSFTIHDCKFTSEKDKNNKYTFYGIHVKGNNSNNNINYNNSPRNFKIYNNEVNNTKYNGILVHAHCSNYIINNNIVNNAQCIGIESEGRLGGNSNTTVHPCKNGIIKNNIIKNCGDWGILVNWTSNLLIYNNETINCHGCFLSIGCKNVVVNKNSFEGNRKGFEISQEFFSLQKGYNTNIIVTNNIIKCMARAENRAVLDIRHAKDIKVNKNNIISIYKDNTAYISVGSSQKIKIKNNTFKHSDKMLPFTILMNNVIDPETLDEVKEMNNYKITIKNNRFFNIEENSNYNNLRLNSISAKIKNKYIK